MRALVELCGDVIELFLAPAVQGSAFGQILAEQAVGVLIGPTSISVEGPRAGVRRGDERRRPRSAPNGRRGVRRASSSGSCVPPKWRSLIAARSQRSGPALNAPLGGETPPAPACRGSTSCGWTASASRPWTCRAHVVDDTSFRCADSAPTTRRSRCDRFLHRSSRDTHATAAGMGDAAATTGRSVPATTAS